GRISDKYNEAAGATKEKIGRATGNESLAAKGAVQNAEAHANQNARKAETQARGVGNTVQGSAQQAVGSATNDPVLEARGKANTTLGDVQRNV
ncbi:hypothetical protein EDD21DRAFT_387602, partial [Dissophora ornata]